MKVLLITTPIMDRMEDGKLRPIAQDESKESPPYGIYLLARILQKAGHDGILIDLIVRGSISLNSDSDKSHIYDCSLVGIGATSLSWPTAIDVIKQIRDIRRDVPIVLGGIHGTMFDQYLLRNFPINFVIRGEGELALPHLCSVLEDGGDLRNVQNLSWISHDGLVVRNPIGKKISKEELGTFPIPFYDLLPKGIYNSLSIESSRGCAFDCSFCSTPYRHTWRGMPPEQFVDRLELILPHLDKTIFKSICIIDDEFSMHPRRATKIVKLIQQRHLNPLFIYDSRANDLMTEDFVEHIAEYTYQFLVGAECGYDKGLEMVGKGTTCEKLEAAARVLYKYKISERAQFSFILGLPWETREEVEKTIRFAAHLFSSYGVRIILQWYCQIPGSKLWEEAREKGIVNEAMYNKYGFFQNLHLFSSATILHPKDIWEIAEQIAQIQWIVGMAHKGRNFIDTGIPPPLVEFFPRDTFADVDEERTNTALMNIREISRPPAAVGTNQR